MEISLRTMYNHAESEQNRKKRMQCDNRGFQVNQPLQLNRPEISSYSGSTPVFHYKINNTEAELGIKSKGSQGLSWFAQMPGNSHNNILPGMNSFNNYNVKSSPLRSTKTSRQETSTLSSESIYSKMQRGAFSMSSSGFMETSSMDTFLKSIPGNEFENEFDPCSSPVIPHHFIPHVDSVKNPSSHCARDREKIVASSADPNKLELRVDTHIQSTSSLQNTSLLAFDSVNSLGTITPTNEINDESEVKHPEQLIKFLQNSVLLTLEFERKLFRELDEQDRYYLLTCRQYWISQRLMFTKVAKLMQNNHMTKRIVEAISCALLQNLVDLIAIIDAGKKIERDEAQIAYSQIEDALMVLHWLKFPVSELRSKLNGCRHWNSRKAPPLVKTRVPQLILLYHIDVSLPVSYGAQIAHLVSNSDISIHVDEKRSRQPLSKHVIPRVGDGKTKRLKSMVESKVLQMNMDILAEEMESALIDNGGNENDLQSFRNASRKCSLSSPNLIEDYYKRFLRVKRTLRRNTEHNIRGHSHKFLSFLPHEAAGIQFTSKDLSKVPTSYHPISQGSSSLSESEDDSQANTEFFLPQFDFHRLFSLKPKYCMDEKYLEDKWDNSLLNKIAKVGVDSSKKDSSQNMKFASFHRTENSITHIMHIGMACAANREKKNKSSQEGVSRKSSTDDNDSHSIYSVTSNGSLISRSKSDFHSLLENRNLTDKEIVFFVQDKSVQFWRGLLYLCNSLPEIYKKNPKLPGEVKISPKNSVLPNISKNDRIFHTDNKTNANKENGRCFTTGKKAASYVQNFLKKSVECSDDNVVRWQVLGLSFGTVMSKSTFLKSSKITNLWVNVLLRLRDRLCSSVLAKILLDIKFGTPTLATLQLLQSEIDEIATISETSVISESFEPIDALSRNIHPHSLKNEKVMKFETEKVQQENTD